MREPTIALWPGKIKPNSVSHQLGTLMDLFSTFISLAGSKIPQDRIIDGIDLTPVLLNQATIERSVFFYRGNELMAVRHGLHKIHLWTWMNSESEFKRGV